MSINEDFLIAYRNLKELESFLQNVAESSLPVEKKIEIRDFVVENLRKIRSRIESIGFKQV